MCFGVVIAMLGDLDVFFTLALSDGEIGFFVEIAFVSFGLYNI